MPRFHFNVRHGRGGAGRPDAAGVELPDLPSARTEALRRAGDLIADAAARADLGEEWSLVVADGAGLTLFTLEFTMPPGRASARLPLRH